MKGEEQLHVPYKVGAPYIDPCRHGLAQAGAPYTGGSRTSRICPPIRRGPPCQRTHDASLMKFHRGALTLWAGSRFGHIIHTCRRMQPCTQSPFGWLNSSQDRVSQTWSVLCHFIQGEEARIPLEVQTTDPMPSASETFPVSYRRREPVPYSSLSIGFHETHCFERDLLAIIANLENSFTSVSMGSQGVKKHPDAHIGLGSSRSVRWLLRHSHYLAHSSSSSVPCPAYLYARCASSSRIRKAA
jgi:hypothetical protein